MEYKSKFENKENTELFEAILSLESVEECYRFFEDLVTINELRSMAQRLQVAKLLSSGMKYGEIEEITKASTATISRVNKCLVYGSDGYKCVLDRAKEK